jgi:hypothetical protein
MAKKPEVCPAVKQSLRSASSQNPKLTLAEARRSAALHAARAARAEILGAERQLRFMAELGGLIEAIRHRYERRRDFLEEAVELGQGRLEEALEDLRGADLRVEHAGGKPLAKDSEVEPWAPSNELAELVEMAKRPGGAR